ncbi:MAG: hypothetical protein ACK5DE_02835 [Bacteroidota bacterium]
MKKMSSNQSVSSKQKCLDVLANHGFLLNRMIAYSKSTYIKVHPDNKVVFNANIATREGKIWWGDLDITKDLENLQKAADELDTTLYILREMDYRFGKETRPFHEVEKLAVEKVIPKSATQTKKSSIKCLQSLASKVIQFFSATRK